MTLALTSTAVGKLRRELSRKRGKPGVVFRLATKSSGGFGMRLDEPKPDDVVLPVEGPPLLAVRPGVARLLDNAALDVGRTDDEPEWVLIRGGNPS